MIDHTPVGRVGQPEDIARAYLFLADERAGFINGAVLSVDGGSVTGT
jgi:3-oxoacyl-[acyl-carrier protein] reductase